MGFVDIKQTVWVRVNVDESRIAEFKKVKRSKNLEKLEQDEDF